MAEFTEADMRRDRPRWYWLPGRRQLWRDAKRRGHPGVRRERHAGSDDDDPYSPLSDPFDGDDDRRRTSSDAATGSGVVAGTAAASEATSSSSDSGSHGSGSDGGSSSSSD